MRFRIDLKIFIIIILFYLTKQIQIYALIMIFALIHELAHCYIDNYITHCDKQYTEEDVADIVSNSYDIIHEIVEQYFEAEE